MTIEDRERFRQIEARANANTPCKLIDPFVALSDIQWLLDKLREQQSAIEELAKGAWRHCSPEFITDAAAPSESDP